MGRIGLAYYGYTDLGSAIEDSEKLVAKIKTNKYTKKDLEKLANANHAIIMFMLEEK